MGCKLGSALFDFGIHPVYQELSSLHPSFTLRCLTDDAPVLALPAGDKWMEFFEEYALFLRRLEELGRPRGIFVNRDKACLLLPLDAPDPPAGVLPDWVKVVRDGLVVAGAAIGTEDFVHCHFAHAVEDYRLSLAKLEPLSRSRPVCGMVLLGKSFIKKLYYLVKVTPPSIVADLILEADALTAQARLAALTPDGITPPQCPVDRARRADDIAALPLRSGGFGHTPLALTAPAAFLSSFARAHQESVFVPVAPSLRPYVLDAHSRLLESIGGPSQIVPGSNLDVILPADGSRLCDSEFFLDLFSSHPSLKFEYTLNRAMSRHALAQVRAATHPDNAGLPGSGLSMADCAHAHLLTSRSQVSRFLTASLWVKANRVCPTSARASMRYILGLPQLLRLGNHLMSPTSLCEVDVCQAHPGDSPELDPTGDHVCSQCPGSRLAQISLHTRVARAVHHAASLCADSRLEPSMPSTLLGEYTEDDCRLLFPRWPNAATNRLAERSLEVHHELHALAVDDPKRQELIEEWASLKRRIDGNTCSRRLDVEITAPDGDVAWVDVAGLHPTSSSYLAANVSFVRKLTNVDGHPSEALRALENKPSPAIQSRARQKKDKFQVLNTIAELQVDTGKRMKRPVFLACIVSHLGELSPDFHSLIGWLTGKMKSSIANGPLRRDGLDPDVAAHRFASDLKCSLMCAIVNGFGRVLTYGGFFGHRLCPS